MATTVVLGAGIIGLSTAYYLSDHQPPSTIHLVESDEELFSSASGYAGGFLARDWFSAEVSALGVLSYELHRKLAESKNGRTRWGYSASTSLGYVVNQEAQSSRTRGDDWLREGTSRAGVAPVIVDNTAGKIPAWLRRVAGDEVELISDEDSTAQLDPLELCRFLIQECLDRGVRLHQPATAISVGTDVRGELASIRILEARTSTETELPCTRVIVAAGCWSPEVFKSLFKHSKLALKISALAGHSLVLKSPRWCAELEEKGCHAIYTSQDGFSPEIYSRVGGHLYLAGLNSTSIPLPEKASVATCHAGAIARLKETAGQLLGPNSGENDLEVVREGLCFRPVTPWGAPIIARIPDSELGVGMATKPGADGGVYIAAGHGPWGISLCLGTGTVLAEMVQGRPLSVDTSGLGIR
jgi:glycine/D-amino acid oxidase-like deaminating enzyme